MGKAERVGLAEISRGQATVPGTIFRAPTPTLCQATCLSIYTLSFSDARVSVLQGKRWENYIYLFCITTLFP
jgi:hypothetical protein